LAGAERLSCNVKTNFLKAKAENEFLPIKARLAKAEEGPKDSQKKTSSL